MGHSRGVEGLTPEHRNPSTSHSQTTQPEDDKMNPPDQKLPKFPSCIILSDPQLSVDSKMYQDLLEMEKKLDWTIMRKKAEVQDALGRTASVTRTLRLFLSHTVSGQAWQSGETSTPGTADPPNFETGQGIPAWQLKVEGPSESRARDRTPPRQFSTLIKTMVVELDRDPALYSDSNVVEDGDYMTPLSVAPKPFTPHPRWVHDTTDGDTPTKMRLILHLLQYPEQFRVLPELGNILGIKEESRTGIIQACGPISKQTICRIRLTVNEYTPMPRCDLYVCNRFWRASALTSVPLRFGAEVVPFNFLPELVNRYLAPPNPVVVNYTVNPSIPPPERPTAWDIELKLEDVALKSKMQGVTLNPSRDTLRELTKLDDESLQSSVLKRQFLQSFAEDPSGFVQTWLASQSRDLESILGSGPSEGATIRKEDLSRSEFFRMPWVEEAVAIWDGMRIANKVTG
ncbi:SWI/SNF complex 60 kDa subunit [Lactarius deliciosus]|nr:SWI/SNF complex 60 kDa subunit [Lactarius deliciosus]